MKYALSIIMLLLSSIVFNMHAAADTQLVDGLSAAFAALNADYANKNRWSARRLNSLIEAYMEGKFAASNNEACLLYNDYEVGALSFIDTVKVFYDEMLSINTMVHNASCGWNSFNFHKILSKMSKEDKISYLKGLQEVDKVEIQALRLYDFLNGRDMALLADVEQEVQKIVDDEEVSKENKADMIKKLMDSQEEVIKSVALNRRILAGAVMSGDAAQVLEACKKPLHIASFVPLNVAITKMIADIEADRDNVLLSNKWRF